MFYLWLHFHLLLHKPFSLITLITCANETFTIIIEKAKLNATIFEIFIHYHPLLYTKFLLFLINGRSYTQYMPVIKLLLLTYIIAPLAKNIHM